MNTEKHSENQKNYGIGRRLSNSKLTLKSPMNMKENRLCSVNRPISFNKRYRFNKLLVKLFSA